MNCTQNLDTINCKKILNNQQTSKFGYTQQQKILNNQQTSDLQKTQNNYNNKKFQLLISLILILWLQKTLK